MHYNVIYKITAAVCVLWLAERYVCMRECEHGNYDIKMFFFSVVLIKQGWIWKKFLSWKHNKFTINNYLPISPSAETWKIFTNLLLQFFHLSWHFKNEWFKRKTIITFIITYARLHVQDFATCKNFAFNQCHNKQEFCDLSLGSSSQIHCIALHVLQTSKEIGVFLFRQSS